MSYDVQVPDPIQHEIASWGLAPHLLAEIYRRFDEELGANPVKYLRRILWPVRRSQYSFALDDPKNAYHRYVFVFHVTYTEDETALVIRDASYMLFDRTPPADR